MVLQGLCSQADCPYLHKYLGPKTPVCKDFMRGYCLRGAKCEKNHMTPRMMQESHLQDLLNSGATKV
jgi:Zinc finger C-x8-C-x5-C-x3-H type (and similar)